MTTNTTNNMPPLDEVLYAFSVESRELNAELLDEYVRAHPDYADALTELAITLALDELEPADVKASAREMTMVTPAVSRAVSKFQNRLYQMKKTSAVKATAATARIERTEVVNPFRSLNKSGFRAVARELNANNVFVGKLRDRQIEPQTMTAGFLDKLSGILKVSMDFVVAHLKAEPIVRATPQFSKADDKPHVVARQSFEEAVRSSGLSDEQQRHLLSL
jgi:hypothetical protein